MPTLNSLKHLALAAVAALGVMAAQPVAAASSTSAYATSALNVRTGPGGNYNRVDTLYAGEHVQVNQCTSTGWCYITHSGPDGWVSKSYLSFSQYSGGSHSGGSNYSGGSASVQVTPNLSLSFSFGNGGHHPRPQPKVCVYKGPNYSGASFCASRGENFPRLPSNWNNKISSVKVLNGASVTLCANRNYNGYCRTFNSSRAHLNHRLNNRISSGRVH